MEYLYLDNLSRTSCRIMQQLCRHGRLHRADLARFNNMTRTAMTKAIQPLMEASLVVEQVGGEPAGFGIRFLEPAGDGLYSLGISIEKNILMVVIDSRYRVLASKRIDIDMFDPRQDQEALLGRLVDELEDLARSYAARRWFCAGIGLSYSGIYDQKQQRLLSVNWAASPRQVHQWIDLLEERFRTKVCIEHDGNAELLAEVRRLQPVNSATNVMSLSFYLGIGLMFDGRVVSGASNGHRWLGNYCLQPQRIRGIADLAKYTLGGLAAPSSLIDRLAGYDFWTRPRISHLQTLEEEDAMFDRYLKGDPEVCSLLHQVFTQVGYAVRNMSLSLPLDQIILVGWPKDVAKDMAQMVQEVIDEWPRLPTSASSTAIDWNRPEVRVGSPRHGDQQGIGVAIAAMERSLDAQAGIQRNTKPQIGRRRRQAVLS